MMAIPQQLSDFLEVWVVDFEFSAPDGEHPTIRCMVAREILTGRVLRYWADVLQHFNRAPFAIGADVLVVAYAANAEMSCFLQLHWSLPVYVLDLYPEFLNLTNGLPRPRNGYGLLGALAYYGLDAMGAEEKTDMRALAIRGGAYSGEERTALLDYCEEDVKATTRLLWHILPALDLRFGLLRGRYMKAVASMERTGIPIDTDILTQMVTHWGQIKSILVRQYDTDNIFDGMVFKHDRWAQWVADRHLPWTVLQSGRLALDEATFKRMSRLYPDVHPYQEIRSVLSRLRLGQLVIGSDHRNRCSLFPYRSATGRNTPSGSKYVFGLPNWVRGLIKPSPDRNLTYLDYTQQEYAVAAVLSGDTAMLRAYEQGDVYLDFAKQAGAAPHDATKDSHPEVRSLFKQFALATQYGQGPQSLAGRLKISPLEAGNLLQQHRRAYRRFWQWSEDVETHARLAKSLRTVFGWQWQVPTGVGFNPRSARNFPVQGNAAEMLRLACSLATERGVHVCAPIHDALLIESDNDHGTEALQTAKEAMQEASRTVLSGFTVRVDAKSYTYPQRFVEERGSGMWNHVLGLLDQCRAQAA